MSNADTFRRYEEKHRLLWEEFRDELYRRGFCEPTTVSSHIVVRKRDMKVFDADAAERLARLCIARLLGGCHNVSKAISVSMPGSAAQEMVDEAKRVLGE